MLEGTKVQVAGQPRADPTGRVEWEATGLKTNSINSHGCRLSQLCLAVCLVHGAASVSQAFLLRRVGGVGVPGCRLSLQQRLSPPSSQHLGEDGSSSQRETHVHVLFWKPDAKGDRAIATYFLSVGQTDT